MRQKLKTKSGAKKRFRFAHAFGSHKFLHKRPDTKRKYRKAKIADDTNMAEMPRLMPYGG